MQSYLKQELKNADTNFKHNWVCDFETIVEQTEYFKKYNRTGLTYGYIESMESEKFYYEFNNITDLFKFFSYKKCNQIIYFHNLSFDGVFILDFLGNHNFKMSINDEIGKEDKTFRIHRSTGSKIYMIDVTFENKYKQLITLQFRCSLHILQKGVESLGKDIGNPKYLDGQKENENFHIREPMHDVKAFKKQNLDYCLYCQNDVKIVKQCLKEFYKPFYDFLSDWGFEQEFQGIKQCITTAAISLRLQIIMAQSLGYEPLNSLYLNNYKSWSIMDKFTNGGLTTNNLDYVEQELNEPIISIDLKSAYPAVMAGKIPIGQMLYELPDGANENDYATFYEIKYKWIAAKNHNIPLLKTWLVENNNPKGLRNYECERTNYKTYLLKEEMEQLELLHNFKGKKILKTYYFKLEKYLYEFVDQMFYYKEYYKKLNQNAKSHGFKIGVNAAYGIHAKRLDFKNVKPRGWVNKTDKDYILNERIHLNKKDCHCYIPNVKMDAYTPINFENWSTFPHKGLANYITAMTRVKLLKGIIHFGPSAFVYSDTDSLFLIRTPREKIEQYCSSGLGSWEIEKEYDKGQFIRSKLYYLEKDGKIVKKGSAGLRDITKLNINQLIKERTAYVPNAIKVLCRVKGGLVIRSVDKVITLQDRIIRNNMKYETPTNKQKELEEYVFKSLARINKEN